MATEKSLLLPWVPKDGPANWPDQTQTLQKIDPGSVPRAGTRSIQRETAPKCFHMVPGPQNPKTSPTSPVCNSKYRVDTVTRVSRLRLQFKILWPGSSFYCCCCRRWTKKIEPLTGGTSRPAPGPPWNPGLLAWPGGPNSLPLAVILAPGLAGTGSKRIQGIRFSPSGPRKAGDPSQTLANLIGKCRSRR